MLRIDSDNSATEVSRVGVGDLAFLEKTAMVLVFRLTLITLRHNF